MEKHYVFKSLFEDNITQVSSIGGKAHLSTRKCMCHSAHIFRCSYSSRTNRRLLVDYGCSSSELCNPIQYCLACRNLSIPPDVKMSSQNKLRYSSGIIVFKNPFPQQTLDALPANAAWWLKASNRSTQRCVFHRATYKDVGMALNLNRLIVSAPSCTFTSLIVHLLVIVVPKKKIKHTHILIIIKAH